LQQASPTRGSKDEIMSALNRISYYKNRRDEVANQKLAKDLAATKDKKGIREIAENLWNENQNIQSDCLKVMYEIGYIDPSLIANDVGDYLKLLQSKNNRIVWGAMIALSTVASLKADEIFKHSDEIVAIIKQGSVITVDNGVKTLAGVASAKAEYRKKLFPFLLHHLETCRPKDVPQHSEKALVAVSASNKDAFIKILEKRIPNLSGSQTARVKRVIREAEKR
jgi:hypothetical protein